MTAEQYERLALLIANPPKGSKLAAAKDFGIDLSLLLENLRRTPTERLEALENARSLVLELRRGMKQTCCS